MKKSFVLYTDMYEAISKVPNEECGILFKTIFKYVMGEKMDEVDPFTLILFNFIKPHLDRDLESWEKIREERKVAGSLGGKARVAKLKQTQANATFAKQTQANQAVNGNVNVNDIKKDIYISKERIVEIAKKYNISETSANSYYEELILYCKRNGKKYKDYEAALMTWIRTGLKEGKVKEIAVNNIPHVDILSEDEREAALIRLSEIRSKFGRTWTN